MTLRSELRMWLKHSDVSVEAAEPLQRIMDETWPDSGLREAEWLAVEMMSQGDLIRLAPNDYGLTLEVRSRDESCAVDLSNESARQLAKLLRALAPETMEEEK